MSAISTYNGPRSAKERASLAWGLVELPAAEQKRHQRLIQATRRIETKPVGARTSRYQQGDRHYWRRSARANDVITGTCPTCLGKRWITVADGHGGVDFDECPVCAPVSTRTDYPTADDAVMDVPF